MQQKLKDTRELKHLGICIPKEYKDKPEEFSKLDDIRSGKQHINENKSQFLN